MCLDGGSLSINLIDGNENKHFIERHQRAFNKDKSKQESNRIYFNNNLVGLRSNEEVEIIKLLQENDLSSFPEINAFIVDVQSQQYEIFILKNQKYLKRKWWQLWVQPPKYYL